MARRVEIRRMMIDDLRAVFLLGSRLYGDGTPGSGGGWSEKHLADILSEGLEISLVAVWKKELQGFLIATIDHAGTKPVIARILWLGAGGDNRAAVGEGLMEAFMNNLSETQVDRVSMELNGPDTELIQMAGKFGFTESKHVLIMENFLSKRDS